MDAMTHWLCPDGKFLGVLSWSSFWVGVGWLANAVFTSRFLVQWYATEKKKQVIVPPLFWWLSLLGALLFLAYAVCYSKDKVIIFAYAFSWLPYIRNLVIHRRHREAMKVCGNCTEPCSPKAHFCPTCGLKLALKS